MWVFSGALEGAASRLVGCPHILFIILGKSFIYKRKSRGPKTEPCRTPCLTLDQFQTLLLFSLPLYNADLQYLLPKLD